MGKLTGRTAMITGGSRGIGRATALRFAGEGANLAINYARGADAAREVAEAARQHGVRAEIYQADVADKAAVNAMCEQAIGDLGQIDILVNNAGLGSSAVGRPTITGGTDEQYQLLLGVNLWGPIHMCRALVPHMRQAPRSDVIMISSIAAQSMGARMGLYSIGKAGMEALAHTLAKEERANGMRVNIVAPGLVDTDMGRKLVATFGVNDIRTRDATSPFGFVCTPEDIAASITFLCSEEGRYITNERITVSGGGF
ncbi:MAG TPA: SDR family oxidoreductase [Caulobacteraceae bacterium]|jgi:NAD(P)-dependent dehydrogenase (short-subunit alcohol dehydrogenase family)|nr:SDR family oxidoreductase [Caulobacteraceae bacterium]